MTQQIQVHDGAAWKPITNCQVHDGGSWKQVTQIYVHDGGAWQTAWVLFSPTTHAYTSGSGSDTIPTGASQVVIEVKAGGGGSSATGFTSSYACGGGGAGYSRSVISLTPANWGQTIAYQVGLGGATNLNNNGVQGGNSTVSSGTFALATITANGGSGAGGNGAGGTASGGNQVNDTGASGVNGGIGGASGSAGQYFDTGNAYGHGGDFNGSNVTNGFVSFRYT